MRIRAMRTYMCVRSNSFQEGSGLPILRDLLTLMLLVANLANTKWRERPENWLKPWHMGTHLSAQWELSNEYQHDRV